MIKAYKGIEPKLHPTVFVAESAAIIGKVTIGEESGIWYGVVVRGDVNDISIGKKTNIQENTVIHVDSCKDGSDRGKTKIGDRVTVGHGAIIHGCTIEDDCLIGMGAIILTGAKIGSGSLIAAGALIPEGTQIPPKSLVVGVPGVIRGQVSDDKFRHILEAAQPYAELALEFKNN